MSQLDLTKPWDQHTFVAFDTETSGAYPVGHDVVEFGAVKWRDGKIVDELQMFLRPREPMSDFIIGIHGITNDMVADAPLMKDVLPTVDAFMRDSILMAHHAAFDIGFMAFEYEKLGLPFPPHPVLCTSLISRKLIYGCENHKLQTLVRYLGIEGGAAHRALDDAKSCLHVGLKSFAKLDPGVPLSEIYRVQDRALEWKNFIILGDDNELVQKIKTVSETKGTLEIIYDKAKVTRRIKPWGLVKSPDGDFVYALCLNDRTNKRFYLSRIRQAEILS